MRREEASEKEPQLATEHLVGRRRLLLFFVVGFAFSFYIIKRNVSEAIASRAIQFRAGIADLENANPKAAAQEFSALATSTGDLGSMAKQFGFLFQGGAGTVSAFMDATNNSRRFRRNSRRLKVTHSSCFTAAPTTVADLTTLRSTLSAIDTDSDQLAPRPARP